MIGRDTVEKDGRARCTRRSSPRISEFHLRPLSVFKCPFAHLGPCAQHVQKKESREGSWSKWSVLGKMEFTQKESLFSEFRSSWLRLPCPLCPHHPLIT